MFSFSDTGVCLHFEAKIKIEVGDLKMVPGEVFCCFIIAKSYF